MITGIDFTRLHTARAPKSPEMDLYTSTEVSTGMYRGYSCMYRGVSRYVHGGQQMYTWGYSGMCMGVHIYVQMATRLCTEGRQACTRAFQICREQLLMTGHQILHTRRLILHTSE